jgi:hypothetical protein
MQARIPCYLVLDCQKELKLHPSSSVGVSLERTSRLVGTGIFQAPLFVDIREKRCRRCVRTQISPATLPGEGQSLQFRQIGTILAIN